MRLRLELLHLIPGLWLMASDCSTVPAKCMKCKASLAFPVVCTGCQTLYPRPQTADYFDLLGLERTYALDEGKLRAAARAITRNIHPDRFAGQPDEVRALATRLSAEANQAVSVLSDPVRRAGYMLELAGGPSAAELRDVPGDLLMEIMSFREQAEQARADNDADALERIREAVKTKRAKTLERIGHRMDHVVACDDIEKQQVRHLINSVKYFDNVLNELAADPLDGLRDRTDD